MFMSMKMLLWFCHMTRQSVIFYIKFYDSTIYLGNAQTDRIHNPTVTYTFKDSAI